PAMSMPTSGQSALTSLRLTSPVVRRSMGLIRRSGRIQSYVAAELEKLVTERYPLT
ncbi:LysR family transcriptional regulator, partial [Cronobacter dublinensis]